MQTRPKRIFAIGQEAAWNVGAAPLLWIITPTDVRLYDCYACPTHTDGLPDRAPQPLASFVLDSEDRLRALDAQCGRIATETGAFWSSTIGSQINRRHRVDRELFAEISALEDRLTVLGGPQTDRALAHARDIAQRFIGRCIFTWYLLGRGIAQPFLPADLPADLSAMLTTPTSAFALVDWLRSTFNGDLLPMDDHGAEREQLTPQHLALIRDFVEGRSLIPARQGQGQLFRFRFNAIPVDLVSSIYQQFARTSAADEARSQGLHYTPVSSCTLRSILFLKGWRPMRGLSIQPAGPAHFWSRPFAVWSGARRRANPQAGNSYAASFIISSLASI